MTHTPLDPESFRFPHQEIARLQRLLDEITVKHSEALRTVEELRKHNQNQFEMLEEVRQEKQDGYDDKQDPTEPIVDIDQMVSLAEAEIARNEWHHRQIALELAVKCIPADLGTEEGIIPLAQTFYTFLTGKELSDETVLQNAKDSYFLQGWAAAIKEVELQRKHEHLDAFLDEQLAQIESTEEGK